MIAHSHHQAARLVWHFQPLTTLNQLFPGRGTQGLLVDMGLPVEHGASLWNMCLLVDMGSQWNMGLLVDMTSQWTWVS